MYMAAKSEMADLQQEHQREMEGLLENVRQLSRELKLHMLIIDSFIPQEYQNMIEQHVHWNEGEKRESSLYRGVGLHRIDAYRS